jgi:hypothetical protein
VLRRLEHVHKAAHAAALAPRKPLVPRRQLGDELTGTTSAVKNRVGLHEAMLLKVNTLRKTNVVTRASEYMHRKRARLRAGSLCSWGTESLSTVLESHHPPFMTAAI